MRARKCVRWWRLSYGFTCTKVGQATIHQRPDGAYFRVGPVATAFVEKKRGGNLALRVEAQNLTGSHEDKTRVLYTVNVMDGALRRYEHWDETRDLRVAVRLRGRFQALLGDGADADLPGRRLSFFAADGLSKADRFGEIDALPEISRLPGGKLYPFIEAESQQRLFEAVNEGEHQRSDLALCCSRVADGAGDIDIEADLRDIGAVEDLRHLLVAEIRGSDFNYNVGNAGPGAGERPGPERTEVGVGAGGG
jgi:hypothetical protein